MDWFGKLEDRRLAIISLVFLLALATVFVTSLRVPISHDSFWHLKMGQDWLESGLSPFRDSYSFTYAGSPVKGPPVAFETGLAKLVEWLGLEGGYFAYRLLSMVLALAAVLVFLWRIRVPTSVYAIVVPLLVVLLQLRATVRPELIAYPLLVVGMLLYYRARVRLDARTMLPIAFLLLVLTNYHNSVVAYVVFFGLFAGHAIRQLVGGAPGSDWLRWAAWGTVALAVGFVNREWSHPILEALRFSGEWKALITEYHAPGQYLAVPATYVLVALYAATLALLVRQRSWGLLVANLILGYNAFQTARLVTPAGIVLLCSFAICIADLQRAGALNGPRLRESKPLAVLALVAFLVPLLSGVQLARQIVKDNVTVQFSFPHSLVAYMQDAGLTGRVFNDYAVGGFLIYHLAPEMQVYIDGRTNMLYPLEHMKRWNEVRNSAELLNEEAERHKIDYAVVSNDYEDVLLMQHTEQFQLDFSDAEYSLYRKGTANFPALGRLWAEPECWTEELGNAVKAEQSLAIVLIPPVSPLFTLMNVALQYHEAEDSAEALSLLARTGRLNDAVLRFIGHRALEQANLSLAHQAFSAINEKGANDYMAAAFASLRVGDADAAETILDIATRRPWYHLDAANLTTLYLLLHEIETQRPFKYFEKSYHEDLLLQLTEMGQAAPEGAMMPARFCSSTALDEPADNRARPPVAKNISHKGGEELR